MTSKLDVAITTHKPLAKVQTYNPSLGCDPEFFFRQNGEVVGSEKFLNKHGTQVGSSSSRIIIDGVQGELNPASSTCRESLSSNIGACFYELQKISDKNKGVTIDCSRAVEISKEKLMELSEESRKFGCSPSFNIHKNKKAIDIKKVDPEEYRIRAAGGHIHIGKGYKNDSPALYNALTEDHKRTVYLMDILCGNTCVLIDRDEANKERRKVYGRAGEYRLPDHGLEYRTLSNFWLTAPPLMSFAFGLARQAVELMVSKNREDYYAAFTDAVKPKNIVAAINNNDFDLAMANFKDIEPLLLEVSSAYQHPIHRGHIKEFHYFVDTVKEQGLQHWFKRDPMTLWLENRWGFYSFCEGAIKPALRNAQKVVEAPKPPPVATKPVVAAKAAAQSRAIEPVTLYF